MAEFFKSSLLSDIEVEYVLAEQCKQQVDRPAKRHKKEGFSPRFPAHKFCLGSTSSVLRHEIEAGATVLKVELDDAQLVPVADAMFASMYRVKDATDGLSQSDRLQLALLCNKYDVRDLLDSTVQQLASEDLGPEVLALFWQLDGSWQQPFWPLLPQVITHKLSSTDSDKQVEAVVDLLLYVCDSDLEAVWTDCSNFRRQLILKLPEQVLTAFLKSSLLRVLSEDTILFTIVSSECYKEAERQYGSITGPRYLRSKFRGLLEVVRVPHLTMAALLFILPSLHWFRDDDVKLAAFWKHSQDRLFSKLRHSSWFLEPRSTSTKGSHTYVFTASVSLIVAACDELLQSEGAHGAKKEVSIQAVQSNDSAYGGRSWVASWRLCKGGGTNGVMLFCKAKPAFPGLATELPWCCDKLTISVFDRRISSKGRPHGYASASARNLLGPFDTSAQLEAALGPWAENGSITAEVTLVRDTTM